MTFCVRDKVDPLWENLTGKEHLMWEKLRSFYCVSRRRTSHLDAIPEVFRACERCT